MINLKLFILICVAGSLLIFWDEWESYVHWNDQSFVNKFWLITVAFCVVMFLGMAVIIWISA